MQELGAKNYFIIIQPDIKFGPGIADKATSLSPTNRMSGAMQRNAPDLGSAYCIVPMLCATAIKLSQIVGAVPSRRLGLRLLFQVFSRREGTAPTNPDPTYPLT